ELPKSLTKLTWDNAALIAPATASRLGLITVRESDDAPSRTPVIEVSAGDRRIQIPIWIAPGHAPDTLTLHVGYGRTRAGNVANGIGVDVGSLRTLATQDILTGIKVVSVGEKR